MITTRTVPVPRIANLPPETTLPTPTPCTVGAGQLQTLAGHQVACWSLALPVVGGVVARGPFGLMGGEQLGHAARQAAAVGGGQVAG